MVSFAARTLQVAWIVAVLLLPTWRALAETRDQAETRGRDRWVPAIGVYSAVNIRSIEALAESTQRGLEDGEDLKVFPALEGHLELMSPALLSSWGQPRLFVRAGAGRSWDSVHLTAENKPGQPVVNLLPSGGPPPLPGVAGQGTGVRTEFSPYFFTASAGLVLTFPLAERDLRVKPSVEYQHGSSEIEGIVSHAISIAGDPNCPCETGFLVRKEQRDRDELGAGLELELDTQRAGPFMISLFASTQAYRVLSGRKLRTGASGFLDDGTTPLDFRARVFLDHWSFRAGLGLRLRWQPD